MSISFWLLWSLAAVVGAVVLFFFVWGLMDNSVSADNIGLWFLMLGVVAVVLLGSLWLRSMEKMLLAKGLLWILVTPGLLYLFFLVVVLVTNSRWN